MYKETKNQKFRRLAEKRVGAALEKIRIIGNLSNAGLYEYSDLEAKKIFDALKKEIRTAESKFRTRGMDQKKKKFSFN